MCYILIASLLFSGCAGLSGAAKGSNYIYTYSLVSPQKSDKMIFRDNYVVIQFFFDASAISFQLQNISEATMSIVWEKVSLGVNKRIHAVRNTSTFYSVGNVIPQPVSIPPLGYIRETIIPRENIYNEKGVWVEKDFFLTNDKGSSKIKTAMKRFVGSEVTLSIPLKIGDVIVEYPFVFKVTKVTPLPSHLLPPVKERPQAPKTTINEAGTSNSLVPILIAGGIFGIAIYLLSIKKTPADDL